MQVEIHHPYGQFAFISVKVEVNSVDDIKPLTDNLSKIYPLCPEQRATSGQASATIKGDMSCEICNTKGYVEEVPATTNPNMFKYKCMNCKAVAWENDGDITWKPYKKRGE